MKEKDLLFFQPLWRRIAVTLFCALWAGWEWLSGQHLWGIIITGVTLYCYWTLFHTFEPAKPDAEKRD
ncbi:hypothetical protein [Zobellella iuensis]|uniref:DUF3329 domain-containing protein n=1 Tax=Zobellella iuensis TaxID=2803811 RepID=A0ABS1QV27_9GAMM|nr:hypothetical protein [Zobellella iuensis]MBL1378487.1 hypothetical protein [Zobellella iuensis]